MTAILLDTEFMTYWSKLTLVEKESLLSVAKNYVQRKEDDQDIEELRRQLINEERKKYLKGEGKFHTWEEVKEMAVNKEKRDGI